MKICVVGAGAVGGLMGGRLSLAGEDVTLVDQGAHLNAIQLNGLKLIGQDGVETVAADLNATDKVTAVGQADLVILALKAHFLELVAAQIPALVSDNTVILPVQSGIPWWYFHKHGGEFDGRRIKSLDPRAILEKKIDADKVIGAVTYCAAEVPQLGVVRHLEGDRFSIGELDGADSDRARAVYHALNGAGFRSRVASDIRSEVWTKALGTLSLDPISALTHANLENVCRFRETRKLAAEMMGEAQSIAEQLGIKFRQSIDKRLDTLAGTSVAKPGMLHDVELGRALEIEAITGAVLELGELTGVPTPSIRAIYACVKLLNNVMIKEGIGVVTGAVD